MRCREFLRTRCIQLPFLLALAWAWCVKCFASLISPLWPFLISPSIISHFPFSFLHPWFPFLISPSRIYSTNSRAFRLSRHHHHVTCLSYHTPTQTTKIHTNTSFTWVQSLHLRDPNTCPTIFLIFSISHLFPQTSIHTIHVLFRLYLSLYFNLYGCPTRLSIYLNVSTHTLAYVYTRTRVSVGGLQHVGYTYIRFTFKRGASA